MQTTNTNWTDKVWNPVTGCTKISAGCKNCYAESIAKRFITYLVLKRANITRKEFSMNVEQEFNNLFVKDAGTINATLLNAPSTILDWIQENFTPKVSPFEAPVSPMLADAIADKTLIEKVVETYKKEAGIIKRLTVREEMLISICYNVFNKQ